MRLAVGVCNWHAPAMRERHAMRIERSRGARTAPGKAANAASSARSPMHKTMCIKMPTRHPRAPQTATATTAVTQTARLHIACATSCARDCARSRPRLRGVISAQHAGSTCHYRWRASENHNARAHNDALTCTAPNRCTMLPHARALWTCLPPARSTQFCAMPPRSLIATRASRIHRTRPAACAFSTLPGIEHVGCVETHQLAVIAAREPVACNRLRRPCLRTRAPV